MKQLAMLLTLASVGYAWGNRALAGPPHGHEGDFAVAHTSTGQLTIDFDFAKQIELPPVNALLQGWAHDDPGFVSLDKDEPKEDVFALQAGAEVALEIVAIDPALKLWTPALLNAPGQQLLLGSPDFHTHVIFHIDSTDPAFDPQTELYQLTFRLLDVGTTGYAASEPFTATFLPVPEPSGLTLLGLGALGSLRRSRRACRKLLNGGKGEGIRPGKTVPC